MRGEEPQQRDPSWRPRSRASPVRAAERSAAPGRGLQPVCRAGPCRAVPCRAACCSQLSAQRLRPRLAGQNEFRGSTARSRPGGAAPRSPDPPQLRASSRGAKAKLEI